MLAVSNTDLKPVVSHEIIEYDLFFLYISTLESLILLRKNYLKASSTQQNLDTTSILMII